MYLALLNKEQKELFLGLAFHLASSDGNYSDEEKVVIEGYCREMQMTFDCEKVVKSIDDIISELNHLCEIKEKKIIVFESIGLAMADNNYDASERKIIEGMAEFFKLESNFIKSCETILAEYISFQGKINQLIIG